MGRKKFMLKVLNLWALDVAYGAWWIFFPTPAHRTFLAYSFFAQQRLKCPGLLKNCSHLHIHTVMYFLFYFNWKTHQTSPKPLTPYTFTSTTHFLYPTFLFALRFSFNPIIIIFESPTKKNSTGRRKKEKNRFPFLTSLCADVFAVWRRSDSNVAVLKNFSLKQSQFFSYHSGDTRMRRRGGMGFVVMKNLIITELRGNYKKIVVWGFSFLLLETDST